MTKKELLEAIKDMPMDAKIKYRQETILINPSIKDANVNCNKKNVTIRNNNDNTLRFLY